MCKQTLVAVAKILFLSSILFSMVGCSTGKKNILFTTKTSFGIDIDTKPSTLDVGYSRREGTISPKLEGGVLPQLASFKSNVGFVNTAVGQSFATGNPAIILSKYLGTDAQFAGPIAIPMAEILDNNRDSWIDGDTDHAERYFFGTDTSFAIKIGFSSETGGYPESFSLGYKRKELAYVPLMEGTINGKPRVGLPALIATADMDNKTSAISDTELQYKQFFATGVTASFLASRPEIRNVLGIKILNDSNLQKIMGTRQSFQTQSHLSNEILSGFKSLPDTTKQVNLFDKAVALGIIDESLKSKSDAEKVSLFASRLALYVNRSSSDGVERLKLLQAHMVTLTST